MHSIEQLISQNYENPHVDRATLFYTGLSKLWRIDTTAGCSYVLKEMPARFTKEQAEREAGICAHLLVHGIPTSEFVRTKRGDFAFQDSDSTFHLQRLIPGAVYRSNACPDTVVDSMGYWLGRIHRTMVQFESTVPPTGTI